MEKEKKRLVKRFHTLLGKAGIDDDGKRDILSAYGVKSSLDLDCRGLMEVCDRLTTLTTPGLAEADRWRKRVMAAIFSYCREMKREVTVDELGKQPGAMMYFVYTPETSDNHKQINA